MDEGTRLAAVIGILLGVWLVRTAVPYFLKQRAEGTVFSFKFLVSGLVSTFVMSIAIAVEEYAIYAIPHGMHWFWVFLGALVAASGFADILNRYAITMWWTKDVPEDPLEELPDVS
jgi:DMSO/TMAO reductase YedYZ heme-binding membrane subunit